MKKFSVLDAKKVLYSILNGELDRKKGLEKLASIKTKNKVLKGYIFGVTSILDKKYKRYSFNVDNANLKDLKRLEKIMSELGNNRFLSDFEKGYFLSWKDYLQYILRKLGRGIYNQ
ncbi:TPA: hypothetical protein EYP83_03545 [Candidatus Geothermarchaeota archaeon]|nr:hypothetical protein [Candidatus Geothermarchaeota archaeon]